MEDSAGSPGRPEGVAPVDGLGGQGAFPHPSWGS